MIKVLAIFIMSVGIKITVSQCLTVVPYDGGFGFYIDSTKYKLPEFDNLSYRAYDENNRCVSGGTGSYMIYYEPQFFTGKHGYYTIVIYIMRDQPIIKERVEAK